MQKKSGYTHAQECEPDNIIKLLYLGGDKIIEVLLHLLGACQL